MSVLWATEVVVVPEGNHRVERVGEEVFPVVDTMSAVSGKCTGGGALYQVSHPLGGLGGGGGGWGTQCQRCQGSVLEEVLCTR